MIVDVVMPKMGESINEGTILEWRKEVGEKIKLDEILLEIGTDKVDSEIPSSAAGIVIEILAKPNDVIEVGEVIARIDTDSDGNIVVNNSFEQKAVKTKDVEKESLPPKVPSSRSKTQKDNPLNKKIFYTPVVMKIASEKEIPFNELE